MPTEPTNTTISAPQLCPECGEMLDIHEVAFSAEAIGDRVIHMDKPKNISPKPGNITICVGCVQLLMFDQDLKLRSLTSSEFRELPGDIKTALHAARRMIQDIRANTRN